MGYALTQEAPATLLLFTFLGLGLGSPYLLLALFPALARYLPRSGPWMVLLKEFMAFPLLGTAVWLLFVLSNQVGNLALSALLGSLVLLVFGIWSFKNFRGWFLVTLTGLTLAGLLGLGSLWFQDWDLKLVTSTSKADGTWIRFTEELLDKSLSQGQPVFINFTAAWCITCKVNEVVTFSNERVLEFLKNTDLVLLKADWTNQNESITKILKFHDRAGVPLYLFYPKGSRKAKVLPEILTPEIFISTVDDKNP